VGRRGREPLPNLEYFYAAVEDWSPKVSIGLNHWKFDLLPDHIMERSSIAVSGPIRRHEGPKTAARRKLRRLSMTFLPTHKRPETWSESADRIGNVWVEDGKICASVWGSESSFTALGPGLAAGKFKELMLRVRDFRYNKGATDEVELSPVLTPDEKNE